MVTASPAKIKATVTVSSGAAIGARDLVVTNKNGQMGICRGCLTVYRPTISGLSPNSFARGVSKVAGVLSVKTTVVGPGQLGLQITVSPAATTGIRDVIVVNHDGASVTLVGGFTVN
jgi:hypothetical protein